MLHTLHPPGHADGQRSSFPFQQLAGRSLVAAAGLPSFSRRSRQARTISCCFVIAVFALDWLMVSKLGLTVAGGAGVAIRLWVGFFEKMSFCLFFIPFSLLSVLFRCLLN